MKSRRRVNSTVGQLSLMNKWFLSFVIGCMFMTVCPAQRQKTRRAASLVDESKPAVFVSFLRLTDLAPLQTGYGRAHLLFRITNNTRWPIVLDMSGVPTKQYGDASLYYLIADARDGKMRIKNLCHVCSFNDVGSGRSLTFVIPRDYASRDSVIQIAYSFAWERHRENGLGSVSTHAVEYYFNNLPKSVLSGEALSNKGMQRTRN
jgi:hypothetical protein